MWKFGKDQQSTETHTPLAASTRARPRPVKRQKTATFDAVSHDRYIEIVVRGSFDETTVIDVSSLSDGQVFVIDVGEVTRINSFGVINWHKFLESVCDKGPVILKRLPPVFVQQAGRVANFLCGARVESFITPRTCLDCGEEESTLQESRSPLHTVVACPHCDGPMELDELADSYAAVREN